MLLSHEFVNIVSVTFVLATSKHSGGLAMGLHCNLLELMCCHVL